MRKKLFLLFVFLASMTILSNAQLMWNLKGGIMPRSVKDDQTRLDWMAGLEMEIPLNQKFNIETGPRYRHHVTIGAIESDITSNKIELPVRFTYKQPLGKNFTMHVGAGPYASLALGANRLYAGIETSIAFNWKCLSIGALYDLPIYKGYIDRNKPGFMATVGIRFKSSGWKYVGIGALAVATVGVGALLVANSIKGNNNETTSTGGYNSGASSDSSSAYGSSGGNSSDSKVMSGSDMQNYNSLRNTYRKWADDLREMKFANGKYQNGYSQSDKQKAQSEMKRIRQTAQSKWGKEIPYDSIEDW